MAIFTFVLEFDGGTYISQLRAASAHVAAVKYADEVVADRAIGKPLTRRRLAAALKEERPVAIAGVSKVWCCSTSIGRKFVLLNIVQTASS